MSEGRKDDGGKAPYHLIAPELLEDVAAVLDFGQRKYEARNWEKGMAWHRPFSAMMRHMWAWWRGESHDPETGLSHLAHAACCVMFLIAYERRRIGSDDRPPFMVRWGPPEPEEAWCSFRHATCLTPAQCRTDPLCAKEPRSGWVNHAEPVGTGTPGLWQTAKTASARSMAANTGVTDEGGPDGSR